RSSPFSVTWDTLINPSIYGSSYHLRILSGNEFEVGKMTDDKFIGESYQFGDSIDISGNQIFFKLNTKYDEYQHPDKLYLFSFNSPDRIAIAYQSGLQIDTEEKESSILIISRSGPTITKEMDFINKFIEVYIDDGLAKNNLIASKVMEFVDDRISTILDTLIVVEGELESFRSQSNVARIDLEGETTLIPVIIELEKKKLDLAFNMSYYEKLVDYVEKYDDAKGLIIPSYIEQGGLLNQVLSNLIQLYSEKVELQYDVTTTNESWRRNEEQISVAKTIIKENINALIEKSNGDLKLLSDEIKSIEFKLGNAPSIERTYYNIQRDYKLNNDLYTYLLQKKASASIAKGSNTSNVTVLDWASHYRVRSQGPVANSIYTNSIATGLAIVSLLVFLLEYFNEKIRTEKDIEACTDIPILALVGHNEYDSDVVVIQNSKSVVAESFRSLRTSINYLVEGKEKFCVMLTSSVSQEGKTFCSINLASAFSILGKRTVILGADMRKPKIFQDFNLKNDLGMSNYLINKASVEEIIQATSYENLFLVSAGPVPPNPSELIGSPRMEQLIDELSSNFDIVIIDTPPLGLVTDALQLTKYTDANLYIVRHNTTVRSQLKFVDELYRDKKLGKLGILVNDFQKPKFTYSY
ncbi:MAG TPA: polysaccharide biosynthesis tyrosine autokinase, partial [Flavobacteriales bacterium]|nr:polysaccharide biosynthesis tyrosine autokinase [Flavobacteriales bacterium]